jgi:hypothetical protein
MQGLVLANEGLFPSGTFVFIAKKAVNQCIPKKPMSSPVLVSFLLPCCWDCNGVFTAEEAEPLFHRSPLRPSGKGTYE